MVIVPVGDSLESLLKKDVVKSGDGLSLGLSPHMMKFFTMEGPFIGLYTLIPSRGKLPHGANFHGFHG